MRASAGKNTKSPTVSIKGGMVNDEKMVTSLNWTGFSMVLLLDFWILSFLDGLSSFCSTSTLNS